MKTMDLIRAAAVTLLGASSLAGQNAMVVRSSFPPSGCGETHRVAMADLDGDGCADFVDGAIAVALHPFLTTGAATCAFTAVPGSGSYVFSRAIPANLDGDSAQDVLVVLGYHEAIIDAYGTGNGSFVVPGTGPYPPGASAGVNDLVVRDFNHDGRDDVASWVGTKIEVRLNLATGWTVAWSHPVPLFQGNLGAGDLDGDGNRDLFWRDALSLTGPMVISIAYGAGNGTFAFSPNPIATNQPFVGALDVADLDADGRDDLVIDAWEYLPSPSSLPIVWGASPGQAPAVTYVATPGLWVLEAKAVDFDRDGILDLVGHGLSFPVSSTSRDVVLFRGLDSRQFSAPIVLATEPAGFGAFQLADVDGDLDSDIVMVKVGGFLGVSWVSELVLLRNEAIRSPGCPGTGGLVPSCSVKLATPGNGAFAIGLTSALPGSWAVLGVSLSPVAAPNDCAIGIDLSPAKLILPSGSLGILPTSVSGTAKLPLPLTLPAALIGKTFYAQWAVLDPQGGLSALGLSFATSECRTIHVW
jgi:hypothetical protein